jgi:hypothetical protein
MRLSREEETFLRAWIADEAHYQAGVGPAKRLQVQQGVRPADLALLIAAGLPDPAAQEAAAMDHPHTEAPAWPWTAETFRQRLAEARATLGEGPQGEQPARASGGAEGVRSAFGQ